MRMKSFSLPTKLLKMFLLSESILFRWWSIFMQSKQDNAPTTTGLRQFLWRSLYLRDLVEQYHSIYRLPNLTHNSLNELNDSLQSNVEKDYVVVVGDFNLPELRWSEDQTTPNSSTGQTGEFFCELFNDNFLQQHIVGSTHSGGNKLDLLLSNHPEVIHDPRALSDEQFPSDHYPIEFFIKQTFKRAYHVRRRVYDFQRGQFQQLQTFLQRSLIEETFSGNIDECWVQWKTQFQEAVDQFIPSKTIVDNVW